MSVAFRAVVLLQGPVERLVLAEVLQDTSVATRASREAPSRGRCFRLDAFCRFLKAMRAMAACRPAAPPAVAGDAMGMRGCVEPLATGL